MVLAVRLAAPPLASAGEDEPAAGWLSVAIVPAAALPRTDRPRRPAWASPIQGAVEVVGRTTRLTIACVGNTLASVGTP